MRAVSAKLRNERKKDGELFQPPIFGLQVPVNVNQKENESSRCLSLDRNSLFPTPHQKIAPSNPPPALTKAPSNHPTPLTNTWNQQMDKMKMIYQKGLLYLKTKKII